MTIKYYTHQNPPQIMGEIFTEPSLTRESDYVSLENLFERFSMEGRKAILFKGASDMTVEEKEQLLAETDFADIVEEDLSVQKGFIDNVNSSISSPTNEEVKAPTQAEPAPEQPKADEPKDA